MKVFTVRVEMENAAFDDDNDGRDELKRILQLLGRIVSELREDGSRIFDVNGNTVGQWRIDADDAE